LNLQYFFLSFEDGHYYITICTKNIMKKIAVLALTISILASCKSKSGSEFTQTDSVAVIQADSTAPASDALYLDDVLACNDYEGLVKKFGAENIIKKATIETGEGSFDATKIFAGTPKEIEVYWQDGKEYKVIGDVLARLQIKDDKPAGGFALDY
jgi:hypothetical protein